ncbi:MAG: S8 family serine peptidase [Bacteroidota bacterium]
MKNRPSFKPLTKYSLTLPSDEFFKQQWYLENLGKNPVTGDSTDLIKGADAKVVEAWEVLGNMGSDQIVLSVWDDGFDIKHPDFAGKITSPKDMFPTPNSSGALEEFLMRINDAHGTMCAGIATAANNGQGVVGVAPNARFMPIRTFSLEDFDLERMFKHAIDNGADVISCSMGLPHRKMKRATFDLIKKFIEKGRGGKGLVFCMASGNEARELEDGEFPTHPNIICVGASTGMDTYPAYSNRSGSLSVVGPGGFGNAKMVTADVGKFVGSDGIEREGGKVEGIYYSRFEGTSASCPLVAGVCALILSANRNLTAKEVKDILESTADKIGGPNEYDQNGHSIKYGFGRVNAANAVRMALGKEVKNSGFSAQTRNFRGNLENKQKRMFRFSVKKKKISIKLDGPEGNTDFDVFVKKGSQPTRRDFDHVSKAEGSNENIIIEGATPGEYFVLVESFKGGGEFSLNVRIEDE